MAIIKEADHLIKSAPDQEVEKHYDEAGLADRIYEWLETPMGTMANHPAWGNNLAPFKFDPGNASLAILMEMAIASKLPLDVRDLKMLGIRVEFLEIDLCKVVIRHQFGDATKDIQL